MNYLLEVKYDFIMNGSNEEGFQRNTYTKIMEKKNNVRYENKKVGNGIKMEECYPVSKWLTNGHSKTCDKIYA